MFEKKIILRSHKSRVHKEKEPEKRFKCPLCENSSFDEKSGMEDHFMSVHDGKAFKS